MRNVRPMGSDLADGVHGVVEATSFSGVVRVDVGGEPVLAEARGMADRAHGIAMTLDTRIGIASGVKGWTALAVMSLVERRRSRPRHDGPLTARCRPPVGG